MVTARAGVKPQGRSRVSNGALHATPDLRGTQARRFRDLVQEFLAPFPNADEATRSLARRIAGLSIRCEFYEEQIASDQPVNDDVYVRAAGTLTRLQGKLADMRQEQVAATRRHPTLAEVRARYEHKSDVKQPHRCLPPLAEPKPVKQVETSSDEEGWSREAPSTEQALLDLANEAY